LQIYEHENELALQNGSQTPWIKIYLHTLKRNSVRVQQKREQDFFLQ